MSVDDSGAGPRPEVELPEDTGTAGMSAEYSLKSLAATAACWRRLAAAAPM
jgi:hypothetical protein